MVVSGLGRNTIRRVGASVAFVVLATSAGFSLVATPAYAAGGPAAGHPFSVSSTLAPGGAPVLGWRDLGTGETGTYGTPAVLPMISPDGTKIAVATEVGSTDRSKISLIDVQTGAETVLTSPTLEESDLDPAWSSDGQTVYFTRASNLSTNETDFIYSVPAGGGSATQAVTEQALQPSVKPGTSTLAYVPVDTTTCGLKTVTAGTVTCVLSVSQMNAAAVSFVFAPRWSPDGTTIAMGWGLQTIDGVGVLDVSSGVFRHLSAAGTSHTPSTFQVASTLSWTADGSQLIYGEGTFEVDESDNVTPTDAGRIRSIDVTDGTHASTIQTGGNAGVDTWFPTASTPAGSLFVPVDPVRIADTRTGQGGVSTPLGAGGKLDLTVTGVNVSNSGLTVPTSATAVVLNVTVVAPTAVSFLSVYPGQRGAAVPLVSNLNYIPGPNVANAVVVECAGGW